MRPIINLQPATCMRITMLATHSFSRANPNLLPHTTVPSTASFGILQTFCFPPLITHTTPCVSKSFLFRIKPRISNSDGCLYSSEALRSRPTQRIYTDLTKCTPQAHPRLGYSSPLDLVHEEQRVRSRANRVLCGCASDQTKRCASSRFGTFANAMRTVPSMYSFPHWYP